MYDIFDDIFDDDYGYGMSSEDIDAELAFEAAMGIEDYDPAYEGIGDALGKIGTKIQEGLRNLLRKVKEVFARIIKFVKDKFAGVRAKATARSSDSKTLTKFLQKLDSHVKSATNKKEAQARVASIKRKIMQAIDKTRSTMSSINNTLSDSVTIFQALQKIGKQYEKLMRSVLTAGNNDDNETTGNDLADRVNSVLDKMDSTTKKIDNLVDELKDELTIDSSDNTLGFDASKLTAILSEITFEKIDFRAVYAAADTAVRISDDGQKTADELNARISDKKRVYERGSVTNSNNDEAWDNYKFAPGKSKWASLNDQDDKDLKFSGSTSENAKVLCQNWFDFAQAVSKGTQMLNYIREQTTTIAASNNGASVSGKFEGKKPSSSSRWSNDNGKPNYSRYESYLNAQNPANSGGNGGGSNASSGTTTTPTP